MTSTLILYESRYGFTERIAKNLALILGPAKCLKTSDFNGDKEDKNVFDIVVLCTPIYSEAVDKNIFEFITKNVAWLKQKKIIILCSCLAENMAQKYISPLQDILGGSIIFEASVGGELILNKLNKTDYDLIEHFCSSIGMPLNDYKIFDENKFVDMALAIKKIKDEDQKLLEKQQLKKYIDDFINSHNTCALATGYGDKVRATPIEYMFINESIYILSEGGEKFSNILINNNVSIAIFEPYTNMGNLAGMQISGEAEIIPIGSNEYISAIEHKNLNYEKMLMLPISLNLIKINIKKIEFLWSQFKKLGYASKQIYYYN